MRRPRSQEISPNEVQTIHIYNRSVRRAFLCGNDFLSGRDYSHRKEWLQSRMEELASIFAFDIATFAIQSNHFHLVVRSRPDIVRTWTDKEAVLKNLRLAGDRWFLEDGSQRKSTQAEVERILKDQNEIARIRTKLSNVSSLMSYFNRSIACRCNREDRVSGCFWDGRFSHTVLKSPEAILTCMLYVDLNLVRSRAANSVADSEFTGIFQRIADLRIHAATEELNLGGGAEGGIERNNPDASEVTLLVVALSELHRWERRDNTFSGWLSPIEIDERTDRIGPDVDPNGRRASQKGFLNLSLAKYLEILDVTGRSVRMDGKGAIESTDLPTFRQLGLEPSGLYESVVSYGVRMKAYFESTERQGIPERAFGLVRTESHCSQA